MDDEVTDIPNMPGYITVKEAASILGVTVSRVHDYIEDGRIPAVRASHVLMLPEKEVRTFEPKIPGRPRKRKLVWRGSPGENLLFVTLIYAQMREGQEAALMERLEEIRRKEQYLFPGTAARSVASSETFPGRVEIALTWRRTIMPDEATRERALDAFRQAFADVLDWSTAQYSTSKILLHT